MNGWIQWMLAGLLCLLAQHQVYGQAALGSPESIQRFVNQHCLECHNASDRTAGLNLETASFDLDDLDAASLWERVHDQVKSLEMPPADAGGSIQSEDRTKFLKTLADELTSAHRSRSDVIHRRLNRNEYENSVRDLFDIEISVAERLPRDASIEGFDNIGEGLNFSPEAVDAYLDAADMVLDTVFGPKEKPKTIRHETNLLEQKHWDGRPALDQVGKMFRRTEDGLIIFQSGYCPTNLVNFSRLRAPAGVYRGTFKVRAIQSSEPVTLRIYAGDTIVGRRERHLVGYYDIPPGDWTTIEFTDRLVEPNGTFQPKCYGTRDTRKNADSYPEPGIEIGDIVIEGPLAPWPPLSRSRLLGDVEPETGTVSDIRNILTEFLPRIFRRPVSDQEVVRYLALAEKALRVKRPFEEALKLALKAALCSPDFLFLREPDGQQIDDFALASRLSYFLWSSTPDEELRKLAVSGVLQQSEVLEAQTERMLKDPKAEAFTQNFTGQWLRLRDLDFTTPDTKLYPEHDELLQISMLKETQLFFKALLSEDLSLLNFIDSDFTFLNQRLAEHYGLSGVRGQAFQRVPLPQDHVRGGVLTQASLLKVTANGTTTSPVLRGVWVLENLLGQTIPPPPDNLPIVEPDIRGTTTLREQLQKHQDTDSCSRCHSKIDPIGFALENFDVIGGWRDNYRTLEQGERPKLKQDPHTFAWIRWRIGPPVDATAVAEDGTPFSDIREYKRWLLRQPETIVNALTRKLMIYALGRRLGFSDREELNVIVERVSNRGYGLRSLIHEIVQSQLFQTP